MREFRFEGKKSQPLIWKISIQGTKYITEHGMLGGAMQTFSDVPGDKGKPGTKGYVNAEDNCIFHAEREIRKKLEHGYIEYIDGKPSQQQVNEIVFSKAMPKNFCGYKPQTSIDEVALEKLHKSGKTRYSRKMDGMCHIVVHHSWGWEIYTRRMDLATERFPLHILELEKTDFGVGTIIVAEAVCYDKNKSGKEDFKAISSFCRSLPEESRKIVTEGKVPEPALIIFDVLFHDGKDLKNVTYDERSKLWKEKFPPADKRNSLLASIDYYDVNPKNWQEVAKRNGWEGFVVTDGSAVPGDKFYSFDGDAKRPKGHYKLKPYYEDDVIVFGGLVGSGKNLGTIGSVFIKQRYPEEHSKAGEWFFCGKVGSGFGEISGVTTQDMEKLLKEYKLPIFEKEKDAEKVFDKYQNDEGIVITIEYGDRQPGTQKFRFPVFCRVRTDKLTKECIAQRLALEEE